MPVALGSALGLSGADVYRPFFILYGLLGLTNLFLFLSLSDQVELARVDGEHQLTGVRESRVMVARLAVLFGVDAFAGGLVVDAERRAAAGCQTNGGAGH